jgi:hypothetical protein
MAAKNISGRAHIILSNTFIVKDFNKFIEEICKFPFYEDFEVERDPDAPNSVSFFYWAPKFKGIIPYNPNIETFKTKEDKDYKSKTQNLESFKDFIASHLCKGEVFRIVSCVNSVGLMCEFEEFIVYNDEYFYFDSGLFMDEPKVQSLRSIGKLTGNRMDVFKEAAFLNIKGI